MKKSLFTLFLFALLCNAGISQDHTITLQGIAFSPDQLTINVGETVQWDNMGGMHNVNGNDAANPEQFFSGNAAPSPWMFSHTFNTVGTYNYVCDPHESFGMTGTITVVGAAAGEVIITEINYNNPGGDDYEFVELYNNGDQAVELMDWSISDAIEFTFPQHTLGAGEFVIVAGDAGAFETAFGFLPYEFTGALNNTGEPIVLSDATNTLVDMVEYADSAPWPGQADGFGPSLVLCDYDSDNSNGLNWAAASTPTGFENGGVEILANPGGDSQCLDGPVIGLQNSGFTVLEDAGSVFITLILSNGDAGVTTVDVVMNMASTTTNGDDFVLTLPTTVTFAAGVTNDTQTVVINLVNDTDIEPTEMLILDLVNATNGGNISPNADQYTLNILDDDTPLTNAMLITGVFDAQPAGAGAKGVELQALADIPDISIFGIGSANNGTGSAGVETPFPAISLLEGECIYVADDSIAFAEFFGFSPDVVGDAANINGDDAIELFENNVVIDVFGDIFVDGTGEPWEHLDGWAYRNSGTGPDGSFFELSNWSFSGVGALVGAANNNVADPPFPVCAYSVVPPTTAVANDDSATIPFETSTDINVLGNDITPISLTTMTIISSPVNGTATANGVDNITYVPADDYCGADAFTYEICDAAGCDVAVVTLEVECPVTYTPSDIGSVTDVDADGIPTSLGAAVELTGIVYGIDLQGVSATGDPLSAIQFTLIDATGGIAVFSNDDFGYTVKEGDEVTLQGEITEFSCVTQLTPVNLTLNSPDNPLVDPAITAFLNEDFESELIQINNLTFVDPSDWAPAGTGFNVTVTNGSNEYTMRIDNDNELFNMPIPTEPFHARGIGGQFNNAGNCLVGYQFLPRYAMDIIPLNSTTDNLLAQNIQFFPNPVGDELFVKTDLSIDAISISNLLGQRLLEVKQNANSLNVSDLEAGIYLVTFQVEEASWTAKFVKK